MSWLLQVKVAISNELALKIRNYFCADTSKTSDNYQIKSFGPYGKWEHIYDFSEDGEIVLDHSKTYFKWSYSGKHYSNSLFFSYLI